MKRMAMVVIVLLATMIPALAAEVASVERGKELFNSTRLGTNQKSCATCHPEGDKLQAAAAYPEKRLVKIVNMCIQGMLAGKPLPADSADMESIVSYLKAFAAP